MEMLEPLWQDAYSPQSLWEQRKNRRQAETPAHVAVWTRHSGVLQDNPLPETRFFGREEELYNLQEAAVNGQKCLISGIGGAGKTELLRQILHRCVQNRLVDVLVIVPYADSLLESFARAFPDFQSKEPEESFHRILYRIEQSAGGGETPAAGHRRPARETGAGPAPCLPAEAAVRRDRHEQARTAGRL